jgi:hypothetical protein
MWAVPKTQSLIAVFLSLMLWPIASGHSAGATTRKLPAASSDERRVIPRRAPRPISRREIFQVIQNDLAQRGIGERNELQPDDLTIQASVPALQDDLGLRVERIAFDAIRRETVFELWTSHEPQYLPFDVTTRRDPATWGFTPPQEWDKGDRGAQSRDNNPEVGQKAKWISCKAPLLAEPGRMATLVMLGQNVRVTTTVVPLQPGIKGQRIFVRDPATGRVMTAEVVGEGLLQTSF